MSADEIMTLLSDGRLIRSSELSIYGLNRVSLSSLQSKNSIVQLSRGVYIRTDIAQHDWIQLAVLSARAPQAVVGLLTAVEYHLGMKQKGRIWLRLPKGKKRQPTLRGFDVGYVTRSEPMFSEEIETSIIHGVSVQCTSLDDSVAECFVFRSLLGIQSVIDVLELYCTSPHYDPAKFQNACQRHRVVRVVKPYIDVLVRRK